MKRKNEMLEALFYAFGACIIFIGILIVITNNFDIGNMLVFLVLNPLIVIVIGIAIFLLHKVFK